MKVPITLNGSTVTLEKLSDTVKVTIETRFLCWKSIWNQLEAVAGYKIHDDIKQQIKTMVVVYGKTQGE